MIKGGMQDWPLLVGTIIDHAANFQGQREVVSRSVEGPIHRTNYAEIARRSRQCASALAAAGVKPQDRIATLAWNTWRHMELWYGIAGVGAIYHTINPRLFEEQIEFIVTDADDRMLFADITFVPILEKLKDKCLKGRRIVLMTDREHMPETSFAAECYEEFIAAGSPDFRWLPVPETAPVGLCYTSGTTGNPKGVLYTHRSNVLHALTAHGADVLNFSSATCVLPVVPMFHANAWSIAFSAPMTGAKLVMPGPRLDGASLLELMIAEGVTCTAGVPTVWIDLIEQMRKRGAEGLKLERLVVGGAACPRWMMEAFQNEFGIPVFHAWGMTEMSPLGTFGSVRHGVDAMDAEAQITQKLKQGAPHYGVEMRIIDDAGNQLPHDGEKSGRLLVKGPCVAREYFNGAGGQILDQDGFMDTGDLATIDRFGYMQITDRAKDIIKSGGEWISSIDLENAASSHPGIKEAAAIGIPSDRWGERPMLLAVREAGAEVTEEDVMEHLKSRIAKWWMPDVIRFIDEMPHTATGKIDKLGLRRLHGKIGA